MNNKGVPTEIPFDNSKLIKDVQPGDAVVVEVKDGKVVSIEKVKPAPAKEKGSYGY